MQDRYLVDLELRYNTPDTEDEAGKYKNPTTTIGVFETEQEANAAANALLVLMEERYRLHTYPDGTRAPRPRMGERYAYTRRNLVSELAYLKTPFSFFLHIKRLKFADPLELMTKAEKEIKR